MTPAHLDLEVTSSVVGTHRPDVFFFDRASAPAISLARTLRASGSVIVFEPSARGRVGLTMAAAEVAHVVKVSAERRGVLHEGLFAPRRGQWQIETAAAAGLRFRWGREPWKFAAAFAATDVDSAGAGDWLTAAFIAALGGGLVLRSPPDMARALRRAQGLAALSCAYVGARALARLPLHQVRALDAALVGGAMLEMPPVTRPRASRAQGVCPVCLGPLSPTQGGDARQHRWVDGQRETTLC